jgi:hypothetical protein
MQALTSHVATLAAANFQPTGGTKRCGRCRQPEHSGPCLECSKCKDAGKKGLGHVVADCRRGKSTAELAALGVKCRKCNNPGYYERTFPHNGPNATELISLTADI